MARRGRKPKEITEENRRIMATILPPEEYWKKVAQMIKANDQACMKLWANYYYGLPAQAVTLSSDTDVVVRVVRETVKKDEDGSDEILD
jgi:hypothetical protein